MLKKLLRQNAAIFSTIIILFILINTVLYYSSYVIYKKDLEKKQAYFNQQLAITSTNIEALFANTKNDLLLLRDLPGIKKYTNSNFKNEIFQKNAQQIFYTFARYNKEFYHIRIMDKAGNEKIEIDNLHDGSTVIIANHRLQNKKNRYYFSKIMRLNQNQIYTSPIDLNVDKTEMETPNTPVIRIATPLFNAQHQKIGALVLSMYFNKIMQALHPNMFVRTSQNNIISFNQNNQQADIIYTQANKPNPVLAKKNVLVNYEKVMFLPNNFLYLGVYYPKNYMKTIFSKSATISILISAIFLFLILFITYLNIKRFKKLIAAQKAIIYSLARLTELRDTETGQHLERTTQYAVTLAKQLQKNKKYSKIITDDFIEDLNDAAFLHDIGKVGIRDSILLKQDKLTNDEIKEMQRHPQVGKQALDHIIKKFKLTEPFLKMASNICGYHHEKYDGTGYFHGLKNGQIPIEARIFALADAYDAIRAARPYKPALSHHDAIANISKDKGKYFDPDIVDAFLQCEQEFLQISKQNSKPQT